MIHMRVLRIVFFFNDTATTEIYTLSLHDALPICRLGVARQAARQRALRLTGGLGRLVAGSDDEAVVRLDGPDAGLLRPDRKSTRLNSSHANISYAVFCLKKKSTTHTTDPSTFYHT